MAAEQAKQITRSTRRGSFHAEAARLTLPSAPPFSSPGSSRSEAITRVCEESSPPPASFQTATRDWCIDADSAILTLSTFELWEALEGGQVQAWMRVWREGMECWTPVGEIAEFAWALAQTPGLDAAPVAHAPPPAEPAVTSPPPRASEVPAPPQSGVRWIALGCLVAATAVGSALLSVQRPAAVEGTTSAPVAAKLVEQPEEGRPATGHARAAHAERGQQRLPRGGRAEPR